MALAIATLSSGLTNLDQSPNEISPTKMPVRTDAATQARSLQAESRLETLSLDADHEQRQMAFSCRSGLVRPASDSIAGIDLTGELPVGGRDIDCLESLSFLRDVPFRREMRFPLATGLAEPMRQRLDGENGFTVCFDFRDNLVLAAYQLLPELNPCTVARVDMTEVNAPILIFGIIALTGCLGIGVLAVWLLTNRFKLIKQLIHSRQLAAELKTSEEQFRLTFNQSIVGIGLTSIDGHWLKVNDRLCQILGYDRSRLIGMSIEDLLRHRFGVNGRHELQLLLDEEEQILETEYEFIHIEGFTIYANMSVGLIRSIRNKPEYFIFVIEDISKRKELADDRERYLDRVTQRYNDLNCLYSIARMLQVVVDTDEMLHEATRLITATWSNPQDPHCSIRFRDRVFNPPAHHPAPLIHSVPIIVYSELQGVIEISGGPNQPNDLKGRLSLEQRELIDSVGAVLVEAIGGKLAQQRLRILNSELEQRVADRTALLDGINHLLFKTLATDSEDQISELMLSRSQELTGSTSGFIIEMNASDDVTLLADSSDANQYATDIADRNRADHNSLFRSVVSTGQPVFSDKQREVEQDIKNISAEQNEQLTVGIPLIHENQVKGMIGLSKPDGEYTEKDVGIISNLGSAYMEALVRLRKKIQLRETVRDLEAANKELEAFSYSVSHDLRAPLRSIDGFSQALLEDYPDKLDSTGKDYLNRVRNATQRMAQLIDDVLILSRISRSTLKLEAVDLSEISEKIINELMEQEPERDIQINIQPGIMGTADKNLIEQVLWNLIGNAWKFSSHREESIIEFGIKADLASSASDSSNSNVYYIRDNGTGFEMKYVNKLFQPFQRLHRFEEFPGTGIGLATVNRIITRHGGRIWADAELDQGAVFYFTLD